MKRIALISIATLALVGCASTAGHDGDMHQHAHVHSEDCGHMMVAHGDHMDYLHDGHLHHAHDGHYDDHVIEVTELNPNGHNPVTHDHNDHMHGADEADHAMIPHGDHMDFLHEGHLHHTHDGHVDEHGPVTIKS